MIDFFKKEHLLIYFILTAGFLVRVIGINFGLPDLYHADEPLLVNQALVFGSGDFNPHYFKTPSFLRYLLFGTFCLYYVAELLLGHVKGVSDFEDLFLTDPSSFYILGRLAFGAFLGALSIFLFYQLLKRFFSNNHAVLSGLFFAFNFLHHSLTV